METILYAVIGLLIFMLGGCLGSFFNVVLYRLPKKEEFIKTRSHCPECKHVLKWYELVPVFSYMIQRGHCRKCGVKMSVQYLLMELLCGGANLWAFISLGFDSPHRIIIAFILFPVLVSLSVEDIRKTEIPYWCTITIAVLGIAATIFSVLPAFQPTDALWWEHLIGMVIVSLPFAVFCFLGAMGGGDVQLTAAAGLLLGFAIVPSVLIALIIGAVFGIAVKISKKRATVCFGPFLSLGIAVGYLYGYDIIAAYSMAF
ncbi:MAG: prepilin peptidase [Oscillospiraceae bacterium]|nr:prepilin peptidase [Oscillospiraceae bacterium]